MPFEQKSKQKLCKVGNYTIQGITLGKGNFAKVELATHDTVGYPVALKVIDTEAVREDYVLRNLEREASILTNLEHPNIIMLFEAIRCNKLYCLALEYVKGYDLGEYINSQKNRKVPESTARRLFYQLVSAVKHMHHRKILHRDLKLENILIQSDGKVKLVDFGLSNFFDSKKPLRTRCGSPEYAAPELFSNTSVYGPGVDMWSLGVVLYAMAMGVLPFRYPRHEAATMAGRRQLLLEKISKGLGIVHREQMKHLSSECQQLLERLLEPNQNFRISLVEVVNHPWFTADCTLPDLLTKVPRHIVIQASEKAFQRMSVLLGTSPSNLEKKIKEKPHDRTYAMFHLLRTNLEMEALSSQVVDQELLHSDSSDNFLCLHESESTSKSSKLSKDDEISSVENSFAGSSHINSKDLSRMDMGLSKILFLDKIHVSAPIPQVQHSPVSSKKVVEVEFPKLEETPHFTTNQERAPSPKSSKESLVKKLGSANLTQRKIESIDDRESLAAKEGSQKINSSRHGLRSEKSRTKLKEEFYMEDIRLLERMGCKPSDIRKLSDIKKFTSHAANRNLDKETETEGEDILFPRQQFPTSKKHSQKNGTKKNVSRNKDPFSGDTARSPYYDNYSYDGSASSGMSGGTSSTGMKTRVPNPLKAEVFKPTLRMSDRIHQDTVSSSLKKNSRGKLPAQRSDSVKITPSVQSPRTLFRSPTMGVADAKPRLIPSKVTSKRTITKTNSDSSSFTSNRSMKTGTPNSGISYHSSQQKSYQGSVPLKKENLRKFQGAPMANSTRCRSNETSSKDSARSPVMTRARMTQSGPDASFSTSKPTAPRAFASSIRKVPSDNTSKFYSPASTPRRYVSSDCSVDSADTSDLPFPTKPIIHKRQSSRLFPSRVYKKS